VTRVSARRPNFNHAVKALLKDIATTMDEFKHVRPSRVLVVAGEARRASRGTVKPLTFAGGKSRSKTGSRRKPIVRMKGKRMLYCITLRPLFFRSSTPQARIATLLHELFHISRKFDGTLSAARRHARLGKDFARQLRPLVRRYLKTCPPELWTPFAYNGEVKVQQWLERPGASYKSDDRAARKLYTEEQLFNGVVRMVTPRPSSRGAPEKVH
jgi:hypothetical protein